MRAFNGKPTKVFVIKARDMKTFAEEAKKYGVLYAAVVNKKQPDGLVDVVVNANDAAKVNRIAERFALSTVDVEKIRADIQKAREDKARQEAQNERTTPPAEKGTHTAGDAAFDALPDGAEPRKTEQRQPADISEKAVNPTKARAESTNPSAPSSGSKKHSGAENSEPEDARPSVREQIRAIKEDRRTVKSEQKRPAPEKARQTAHKQPVPKKKPKLKGR